MSAPLTLQSGNDAAVCISPCFLISKSWIYLRPKGDSNGLWELCTLLIFILWKTLDLSLLHARRSWEKELKETSALLGEIEIISRVESFDYVVTYFWSLRSARFPILTTCRFSEFDTSAICRAVLIFCLGSPVEFYCKTCFEVLSIASLGTKIKMFRENNDYFDSMLKRWDRIFDWNCKHSVLLLDHGLYYLLRFKNF